MWSSDSPSCLKEYTSCQKERPTLVRFQQRQTGIKRYAVWLNEWLILCGLKITHLVKKNTRPVKKKDRHWSGFNKGR